MTGQSVIKGFRQQAELSVHLTTVDANLMAAGRYFGDAFYQVPPACDPAFLSALLDIVDRQRIQLLIPIVDHEFEKLAENRDEFSQLGCRVAISPPKTVATCKEKDRTYRFFVENGIPTPRTWLPSELPAPSEICYPVFLKPRVGASSIDTHKVCDSAEFVFFRGRMRDMICQEFVHGEEYTIDVLADFEGKVIGVVPRHRMEMRVGISYKGITVRDPELIRMAKFIAERAGIIGPANIQCFRTAQGLVFFEINPRFSGTLPLTIAAGFNSPLILARLALGEKIDRPVDEFEDGLVILRFWDEVFVKNSGKAIRNFVEPVRAKACCQD